MTKRWRAGATCFLLLVLIWPFLALASANQPEGARSRTTLNQDWRYADGPLAGAQATNFDDAGWGPVSLPHTWNAEDAFDKRTPYRRGEGWYRRNLSLVPELRGKRLFVYFEGANQVAEVFVNGRSVGTHVGGYTAFAFDITPLVRFDAPNVLAVRVDNRHDADIPPLEADFTFYGGIYRDAWLIATDPVHIDVLDHASPGVYVDTPRISEREAVVRVRGAVVNHADIPRELRLSHRVLDASGAEVARMHSQVRVARGGRAAFAAESPAIAAPKLWSLERPRLYRVTTEISDGRRVIDRVDVDFGMRWFRFDPLQGFTLNGRPHALHGSNRHQDAAGHGNALSDEQHRRDVRSVKDTGFNFLRLAHYPQDGAVLQAADEAGLAVWEEIPVVNLISTTDTFAGHAERMLVEMIRQHYNHPSIVMWGYMNEVMQFRPKPEPPDYDAKLLALARRLEARARAEDPFRVTATAISFHEIDNGSGFQDIPQVLGLNLYFGWYYHDLESLGAWLDEFHTRHPERPLFISEYGADSDERIHAGRPKAFDFSNEYQQRFHEASFAQMAARPWLAGTAVWNQFDFGSAGRQDSKYGLNQKGLYFYDRAPKDVLYYYRARLRSDPVLHIATREWPRRAGSRTGDATQSIVVYSNLAEVELLHDDTPVGRVRPQNAAARFDVTLKPGENRLRARGARDGREVEDAVTIVYEDRQPLFSVDPGAVREIAVNAGGSYAVVTEDGVVWEAGRPYVAGSWGHRGGRSVLSHHRIFGTADDPLWQDTLAGVEAFRFDVADGEYGLELGFVEVEHTEPGKRIFDVAANGRPIATGVDLASRARRYAKVVFDTRVRASSGTGVEVRLRAQSGETTLSTIRLRRL